MILRVKFIRPYGPTVFEQDIELREESQEVLLPRSVDDDNHRLYGITIIPIIKYDMDSEDDY